MEEIEEGEHFEKEKLIVTSPAFLDNGNIPQQYTCDGENVNPPLQIENLPNETESLVLIVDDPDAPETTFDHWIVWNITPRGEIEENSFPGMQGTNSQNKIGWTGPCPPDGTHRYFFKIYALDRLLNNLQEGASKTEVEDAMEEYIVGFGKIVGLYSRK